MPEIVFIGKGRDFAYIESAGEGWNVRSGGDRSFRLASGWSLEDAVVKSARVYTHIQIVIDYERRVGLKRIGAEWRGGTLTPGADVDIYRLIWRERLSGRDPVDVARRLLALM